MAQKYNKRLETPGLSLKLLQCLEGHTERSRSIDISTRAKVVVSGSYDGCLVWKADSGECIGRFDLGVYVMSVSISEDGNFFVAGCVDGTILIGKPERIKHTRGFPAHSSAISCLRIASESKTVAAVSTDHVLAVWDILNYKCNRVINGPFESVAVNRQGDFALTGDRDGAVSLWNLENGKCQKVLQGHLDIVMGVALSIDNEIAVSSSFDGTVRIWNIKEHACIKTIRVNSGYVNSVGLTADGKLAISGSDDGTTRFWSIPSGEELMVLEGEETSSSFVCIAADGSVAITGSKDGRLYLWEINSRM
jgi:WD40 repeat protein